MNENEIKAKLARYKFYHIIKLTENIYTPGIPAYVPIQRPVLEALKKIDLNGKRVLDIGCRDRLFSFEVERMGSLEVIGIDNDLSKPAVEFLIPYFKSSVKMYEMNLFNLNPSSFGLFDVVIFAGVLYHLRYPFWALKIIRDVLKDNGKLVLETAIWRGDSRNAMLYCPIVSESPYEPTSCTFFNEKGLRDSLYSLGFEVQSVEYLTKQASLRTMRKKLERIAHSLSKRVHAFNIKGNIDRAVFVCSFSKDVQNKILKDYWDGLHDLHDLESGDGVMGSKSLTLTNRK